MVNDDERFVKARASGLSTHYVVTDTALWYACLRLFCALPVDEIGPIGETMRIPKVIHQPRTQAALRAGIATVVKAIAPTLGPLPRRPVAQNLSKFEMLDDGGVIARRIISLNDQEADVGAMLLRQVVWKVRQHLGDGAATTAVLYDRIYKEGLRCLAAGADPMRLRSRLLALLPGLSARLLADTRQLRSEAELEALAYSVCYDEEMAAALGEIIYTVGQYGQVDIRAGHGRGLTFNFVEGSYWKGGVQSKEMLRGSQRMVAELHDAAILVTDMDIEEPGELVPAMQMALRCGITQLLLIVASISEKGLAVALDERLRQKMQTLVVAIDSYNPTDLSVAQADIALLAGGRPLLQKAGDSLDSVKQDDFGRARWIWADNKNFGFASGKGDPVRLRQQVRGLREAYAASSDDDERARLLTRLGALNGGLATVHVGGIAEDEIRQRKEQADRTIRALRGACSGGVIAGGGVALWGCRDWLLAQAAADEDVESRAARQILAAAVEAPIRQLLENAGYDASEALAALSRCGPGTGFDVMKGAAADAMGAGIVDVAQVQVEALRRAVASAALALTIDVLVLHREPETMTEP